MSALTGRFAGSITAAAALAALFGVAALAARAALPQNAGPPVELDLCKQYYAGGLLVGRVAGMEAQFTNDTKMIADVVEIQVFDSNGNQVGTIRDVGNFAPGIEITHRYRQGAGQLTLSPLFGKTRVSCNIISVHFTNGVLWQAHAQPAGSYSQEAPPAPKPT